MSISAISGGLETASSTASSPLRAASTRCPEASSKRRSDSRESEWSSAINTWRGVMRLSSAVVSDGATSLGARAGMRTRNSLPCPAPALPALRRVLERVLDEVGDDLLEPHRVAVDERGLAAEVQEVARRPAAGAQRFERLAGDLHQVHHPRAQPHLAGDQPRHVEQVV